jgi:hypothetical protein
MLDIKNMTPTVKRGSAIAVALVASLAFWFGWRQCQVGATPPPPAVELPAALPDVVASDAGVSDPTVIPTTAQIVFSTVPPAHATVSWGKKRLGKIAPGKPLVVVRPRDSGPLDVIVRADGFLPVHSRAHTFSDNKVMLKLTRPDQTATLLGYRVPIDAGVPGLDEAGMAIPGLEPMPGPGQAAELPEPPPPDPMFVP